MKHTAKLFSLILLLSVTVLFSCNDDDRSETYLMRINHYTQPAEAYYTHGDTFFFVQTKDAIGSDEWEWFGFNVRGLDFELGYTYDIIVKMTPQEPGVADGGPTYSLVQLIKKTKVPADVTFNILLAIGNPVPVNYVVENSGAYGTVNGIGIQCGELCDELSDKLVSLNQNEYLHGTFRHVDAGTIQLVSLETTGPQPN